MVLSNADVEALMSGKANKNLIEGFLNNNQHQSSTAENISESASKPATDNKEQQNQISSSGQKTKKRDREEAFGKLEEPSIEDILGNLKQRVLNNETLNNFKKEVNLLVELIEKKDP